MLRVMSDSDITRISCAYSSPARPVTSVSPSTTGTMLLAHSVRGRAGTEDDEGQDGGNPRVASEKLSLAFAKRGVRTSIMRLAPSVHSSLDHFGFIPLLVAAARKNGFSAYVGEGAARWPAVHTLDAAHLYRLALEAAPAGSHLHAAADEGVAFRSIAEAIGRGLNVPAKSLPAEQAGDILGGFLGMVAQVDNLTSSARTRELLGWKPTHAGLLADLAERHYFEPSPASR